MEIIEKGEKYILQAQGCVEVDFFNGHKSKIVYYDCFMCFVTKYSLDNSMGFQITKFSKSRVLFNLKVRGVTPKELFTMYDNIDASISSFYLTAIICYLVVSKKFLSLFKQFILLFFRLMILLPYKE